MAGTSFCVSEATGDIVAGTAQGLFYRDTRFLSGWRLTIDGAGPEPLSVLSEQPFSATFIGRAPPPPGRADSSLLILRSRSVGGGMHEEIVVRNLASVSTTVVLTVGLEADFAHLFDVKDGPVGPVHPPRLDLTPSALVLSSSGEGRKRGVSVSLPPGAVAGPGTITIQAEVRPRSDWSSSFHVGVLTDGVAATARGHPPGFGSLAETAAGELRSWRERITALTATDPVLSDALAQGVEDIGALRMVDPGGASGGAVVAAGAPWFMALFGRDSLITSWMTMILDPTLASETLATLAEYQGQRVDVATEEQPGRILHEMRWGLTHADVEAVGDIYYGTVDATPLFVMLLGALARWGGDPAQVQRLLPAADRALGWIEKYGDIDGDGFVEYRRSSPEGLVNQGWKDSWDGINFADGHLPKAPIALCEVQGYVYAAYRARAGLALQFGDAATAAQCQHKAETLKDAFNQVFWLPGKGYFAVGLDAEKEPIDALTSNLGHCLWTGIIDSDKVAPVVNHLLSSTMFSGWGLRTLSTEMGAYNPVSYHNGSVWPHDTAIAVAGLVRYGQRDAARSLLRGLLDASACFDGRLPELFCGFAREEFRTPVAYPSSCSPQAWASAVPFSLVTSLLGLTPDVPGQRLQLRPMLSPDDGGLGLAGLSLGRARVQIDSDSEHTSVRDLAGIVLDALEP